MIGMGRTGSQIGVIMPLTHRNPQLLLRTFGQKMYFAQLFVGESHLVPAMDHHPDVWGLKEGCLSLADGRCTSGELLECNILCVESPDLG